MIKEEIATTTDADPGVEPGGNGLDLAGGTRFVPA
jgi:hypothetical protein